MPKIKHKLTVREGGGETRPGLSGRRLKLVPGGRPLSRAKLEKARITAAKDFLAYKLNELMEIKKAYGGEMTENHFSSLLEDLNNCKRLIAKINKGEIRKDEIDSILAEKKLEREDWE